MKSEKIADQKLLIETQHGQINSVQETVKSEIKSWADVVKKDTNQRIGKPLTENAVKQAIRNFNEEEIRSKNLMIYGCEESDNEADFEVTRTAKNVLQVTDEEPMLRVRFDAYRIGKKQPGKNRPIKVELGSAFEVETILMRARRLKDSDNFRNVYLGPDRTKEEQLAHNKLVKEMKEMIEKDPSKH